MRSGLALAAVLAAAILAEQGHGQDQTVKDAVYTEEQAGRGRLSYDSNCAGCHGADLGGDVARPLKGEKFIGDWRDDTLSSLFGVIKRSMPVGAPSSLSDAAYVDILASILNVNGFPAGTDELELDHLKEIRIVAKDGTDAGADLSLVQVTGCLRQAEDNGWIVSDASEPVRTRDPAAAAADSENKESRPQPLGMQKFRLVYVYPSPDKYKEHKIEVRGLLIKDASDPRINVTSLRSLSPDCR